MEIFRLTKPSEVEEGRVEKGCQGFHSILQNIIHQPFKITEWPVPHFPSSLLSPNLKKPHLGVEASLQTRAANASFILETFIAALDPLVILYLPPGAAVRAACADVTMTSAIEDDELSISLPAYDGQQSRPNLQTPVMSPPSVKNTPIGESPGSLRTANRLDQYRINKTLGEGSFGKVKLATHKVTGQEVALKIISRRKLISRDMQGRVEREISYLQLLRHPHIIKLYE